MIYDLCFAWNWEFDTDFAQLLEEACRNRQLTLLQVTPANVETVKQALVAGEVQFRAFYDRASDADPAFLPLEQWASENKTIYINPLRSTQQASNKTYFHYHFIGAGIQTPYTIVLPPYNEQPVLELADLSPLGPCFNIKPAHGGGGEGVILEATTWEQALAARQQFPEDQYLLQAFIDPVWFGDREAWYRVLCCDRHFYPCWWDTHTHIYAPVTEEEEKLYALHPLCEISALMEAICDIEVFSTEIARTAEGLFVVVDYINDPIDLRLQSKTPDGIPDHIVKDIAERIAAFVDRKRGERQAPESPPVNSENSLPSNDVQCPPLADPAAG